MGAMEFLPWNSCHDDFLDLEHDLPRGSAKHGKTGELGHGVGWEAKGDCGHFSGEGRCLMMFTYV